MTVINRDTWYKNFDRGAEEDTDDSFAGPVSDEFLNQLQTDLHEVYKILTTEPRLPKDKALRQFAKALIDVALPELERLEEYPELFVFDEEQAEFAKVCEDVLALVGQKALKCQTEHHYHDAFVEECHEARHEQCYPGYWTGMKSWDQFLEDHPESFPQEYHPEWKGDTRTLQVLPPTGLKILDHWLGKHEEIAESLGLEDDPPRCSNLFTRTDEADLATTEFEVDAELVAAKLENTNVPLPLSELGKFLVDWESMYADGDDEETSDDEEEGTFPVQVVRHDRLVKPYVPDDFGVVGWEPESVLSLTGEAPPSLS
ncbi:MAG: hypothetical protein M1831_000733 [Alyxoria varia]|nr:MAG: hypothetical protein M1831_000733 [Alyxoria varia]